jgi:hypothetical protein
MKLQNLTVMLLLLCSQLCLLPAKENAPKPLPSEPVPQVFLKQETFRLPKKAAQALLLAGLNDAELHAALREMVSAKTATLANLMLLRTHSGMRSKLEQIHEFGYCTDWDDGQLPQTLTLINPRALGMSADPLPIPLRGPILQPQPVPASNAGFGGITTVTPTTFSIRNLGDTIEVDTAVDEDKQRIALTVAIESVQFVGMVYQKGVRQPQFESQKLNTSVNLTPGAPCFLGTLSKSFQTGTVNANQDDQLSLAFITGTVDAPPAPAQSIGPSDAVRFQWELISLPREAAFGLLEEASDSVLLHDKLRAMMKTNAAKLEGLQSLSGVETTPSTPSRVTAADEYPFPSGIYGPHQPQTLTIAEQRMMDIFHQEGGRDAPAPDQALDPANGGFGLLTRAMPSQFTTRNVGDYMELQSALHTTGQSLNVAIFTERVHLLGLKKTEGIEQPVFESQKLLTRLNLEFNRPLLLGTMSPPLDTGADYENTSDRIWLSFLTAKVPTAKAPTGKVPTPVPDPAITSSFEARQVLLREEWFTLPQEELRLMLVAGFSDPELRMEIKKRVAQQTATMDRFLLIRTKSGQRAKLEHINEFPYPTDFDPPQVNYSVAIVDAATVAAGTKLPQVIPESEPDQPQQAGHPMNGGLGLQNTATPTTYTVRNIGDTLEVDPVLNEDGKTIDLTFASEQVRFFDSVTYAGYKHPEFQTRKLYGSLVATSGLPVLAGTCSRASGTGRKSGNDDANVTVSFLTPTITKVPKPLPPKQNLATAPTGPRSMRLQFELISVLPNVAVTLTDEGLDDPTLHQRLVAMIGENTAQLEKLLSLRTMSSQRAKVEQIAETPYPTDFHVPQLVMNLTIADPKLEEILRLGGRASQQAGHRPLLGPPNAGFGMITGLLGSTWTVRNAGETVEIDPVLGEDGIHVDLMIAPESVRLVGEVVYGEGVQPVFETQKLITSITTTIGQPCLLGTMSKPYRTGAPGGNQTDRVWLAFITPFLD